MYYTYTVIKSTKASHFPERSCINMISTLLHIKLPPKMIDVGRSNKHFILLTLFKASIYIYYKTKQFVLPFPPLFLFFVPFTIVEMNVITCKGSFLFGPLHPTKSDGCVQALN